LSKETKESDSAQLPPWKRGKKKAVTESSPMEVDIVVASPPAASNPIGEHTFGIKDSKPATFTGDRGGAAEDAELLAELRAISAKSSSASRFADESNHDVCEANKTEDVVAPTPKKNARENLSGTSKSKPVASELPPWKRGKSKGSKSSDNQVDIVVAAPPNSTPDQVPLQPQESNENQEQSFGIKSSLPSTFQGDRGGSAEDAELLAELRAISQKSFSADRFSDNIGAGGDHANTQTPISHADAISEKKAAAESKSRQDSSSASTSKAHSKSAADVPWKRANKKATKSSVPDVDVVIAASPAPPSRPELLQTDTSANEPLFETFGIKSALPSTFKGDRGGVAEDEELLAELRAISAKSTGTARFAEDSSAGDIVASELAMDASISDGSKPSRPRPSTKEPSSKVGEAQLPPWKRDKDKATGTPDVDVIVAAPERPAVVQQNAGIQSSLPSTFQGERGGPAEDAELLAELRAISSHSRGGIKSDLPSTFKGERGGSAEDADLLAELRAISSNSSSANRSKIDSAGHKGRSKENADQPVAEKPALATPRDAPVVPTLESQKTALPSNAASGDSDISVTRDSLPTAVTGKSWKLRKEAYDLLHSILSERIERGEGHGNIDGNSLLPGLDDLIVSMVSDGNAGALDSALVFAVDYAEHGSGVTSSELAAKIVASLIKGSALSSSRPSTSKSATALTLKLMEVGDGYASVHSVTEVLLSQGLSSRKPKIVIASSSLILEAAYGFGAGSLPLASISSSAPKMLSHTNATVRDTAMKIIAEICRALGSKSPLQSLIEGMKKAQVSQLDNLLDSQTEPTPIGIGLRSSKGSSSQSPADALAALETGAKELEAKRYAEREPVNIFQALSKTDYSTRIKLPKWSEKVAALDLVLECGGETPYKLVHPSPLANYSPIISEMKALLSHSHFAVASKAMQVLSMLAEGVGSGLFSHLRPLLHQLIMLSKDKKLNQAVGECLDVYFGNVLDIEHLLDTDDALPSVLNEKVQKNALVRASALHFLGRCAKRGESAGPRGRITGKSASSVARLCSDKLDDSDASVRKAAIETLRVLLSVEDEAILDAIMPIIETLQTKNSRAYKSLMKGSGIAQRIGGVSNIASGPPVRAADNGTRRTQTSPPIRKSFSQEVQKTSQQRTISQSVSKEMSAVGARSKQSSNKAAISTDKVRIEDSSDAPSLEDAISLVASMSVPSWDAPDDDGGVLAGLKCKSFYLKRDNIFDNVSYPLVLIASSVASKWLLRQNAILNLAAFSKEEESPVDGTEGPSAAVISVVKGHTKNFKETNVNVTKAIMELFIALSQIHVEQALPFPGWASRDAVSLAVEKIADKKLSALSSKLMSELCCVRPPQSILEHGIVCIDKVKSPLGHEAFLKWFQVFLSEFGALPISGALKGASPWLIKVRRWIL
jgi:cytoskeleton-associated protein 5